MDTQVRAWQYQPEWQALLNTVQFPEHTLYASRRRMSRSLKDSFKLAYEWLQTTSVTHGGYKGEEQRCLFENEYKEDKD